MPFQDPTESNNPEIPDGNYILQCAGIEEDEPGQYGPRMKWIFLLWDQQTGAQITWEDGNAYEWWVRTSQSLGSKANARKYAEALLARELVEGDTGAAVAQACIGKNALATIAENDGG